MRQVSVARSVRRPASFTTGRADNIGRQLAISDCLCIFDPATDLVVPAEEANVEESLFVLAFGVTLQSLGAVILYYLIKLCLDFVSERKGGKKEEPDYVLEINNRLNLNNIKTERDLI
jgi:hypothetical protein